MDIRGIGASRLHRRRESRHENTEGCCPFEAAAFSIFIRWVQERQLLNRGGLGRIALPNVDAVTPAVHRYQASAAATRPTNPPAVVNPAVPVNAPRPSRMNTTSTTANSSASTAVVFSAAISINDVKIAQEIRYQPAATP